MLFNQAPANSSEQESDPPSRRLLDSPLHRPLGQTRFRDNQPGVARQKLPSPTASTLMPPTRSQSAQSCGGNEARIERPWNEHLSRSVDDGDKLSDGATTFLRADP
jgi:hypothetical protein